MPSLIEMLERKKRHELWEYKGHHVSSTGLRSGTVDYDRFAYCGGCATKKPKDQIWCDYCGKKLRHNPLTKKGKYWESKMHYY